MTSLIMVFRAAVGLALALSLAACNSSGGGSGSGGGGGGSGDGGGGEDAGEPPADLFACDPSPDCFMDFGHLGESVTPEATACESDAVLGGGHAVLASSSTPGPDPTHQDGLVVLLGDGTALSQGRTFCTSESCSFPTPSEGSLSDLQRCDVVATDIEPSRCGFEASERCVFAALENCQVVPAADFSCEDAASP